MDNHKLECKHNHAIHQMEESGKEVPKEIFPRVIFNGRESFGINGNHFQKTRSQTRFFDT